MKRLCLNTPLDSCFIEWPHACKIFLPFPFSHNLTVMYAKGFTVFLHSLSFWDCTVFDFFFSPCGFLSKYFTAFLIFFRELTTNNQKSLLCIVFLKVCTLPTLAKTPKAFLNKTQLAGFSSLQMRTFHFIVLSLQNCPLPIFIFLFYPCFAWLLSMMCLSVSPLRSRHNHLFLYLPLYVPPRGVRGRRGFNWVKMSWLQWSWRWPADTLPLFRHSDPAEKCGDHGGKPCPTHSLEALALRPRHGSQISPSCLRQCCSSDSHQQQ